MYSSKTLFVVALIAFSCFTFGHSLKCYVCDSLSSCNTAEQYECNAELANKARYYLSTYYTYIGADGVASENNYNCFSDNLNYTSDKKYYKGCTSYSVRSCDLQLRDELLIGNHSRSCYQCNNFDGCNSVGFVSINVETVFTTLIFVLIARYLYR